MPEDPPSSMSTIRSCRGKSSRSASDKGTFGRITNRCVHRADGYRQQFCLGSRPAKSRRICLNIVRAEAEADQAVRHRMWIFRRREVHPRGRVGRGRVDHVRQTGLRGSAFACSLFNGFRQSQPSIHPSNMILSLLNGPFRTDHLSHKRIPLANSLFTMCPMSQLHRLIREKSRST